MLIFKILNGFIDYSAILKLFKFYKSKNILELIFSYYDSMILFLFIVFFFYMCNYINKLYLFANAYC